MNTKCVHMQKATILSKYCAENTSKAIFRCKPLLICANEHMDIRIRVTYRVQFSVELGKRDADKHQFEKSCDTWTI